MTRPRGLALALAVTAAMCAGLCAFTRLSALEIAGALPLALYLPGASITLMADPGRRHLRGSARLMWASLGSLATAIVGGLILNEAASLTLETWTAYLLGMVLVSSAITWWRGPRFDDSRIDWFGWLYWPAGLSSGAALLVAGALILVGGALALSDYSSISSGRESFVQLWLLPIPSGAGSNARKFTLGIRNYEGHRARFEVSIVSDGTTVVLQKQVVLDEGQDWTQVLRRKDLEPLAGTVALASDPSHVLASVDIATPVR